MGHVVREIAQADPREFALFLGAGASCSSGVPTATEMIEEWRRMAHRESATEADFQTWLEAQSFYRKENEYSFLFEQLFRSPRARQRYVEPKMEGAFPNLKNTPEREMLAALDSSPKDPRIIGNLGIIYLYQNRTDQAEHYLRLSAQLN